ncbi:hypothetical protein IU405_00155, partial [Polaribacter sp. BAL334]|uniref:hypothetical protein n=1 Tax=Polaribacter sp. BAL334 TaxID=1708178 RepID=UPI0018D1FD7F
DLERYQFESVIESLGYEYKPLKDFVQGVCDVNSFLTYKSFLDIPIDEKPEVIQKVEAIETVDIIPTEQNPYPRIFKDYTSYVVFKKLHNEFGNTRENLSNYSYVFHKMTYEDLIHYDLLHRTYIEMLSDFDIS